MNLLPKKYCAGFTFFKDGELEQYKAANAEMPSGTLDTLAANGATNLSMFTAEVDGKDVAFNHFRLDSPNYYKPFAKAAKVPQIAEWFGKCAQHQQPHPFSAKQGKMWRALEPVYFTEGNKSEPKGPVRKVAAVTGLKFEKEMQYRTLHLTPWQGVLDTIAKANIRNYSIYLTDIGDKLYLFSYFEYIGDSYKKDMEAIGDCPVTQRWWKHTDPCQIPLPTAAAKNEIWTVMDEIPWGAQLK
ncbi:L-rhamnose mutarotase [Persicirhabdus sediminis]|uniref:L-rhamnose mutarotase n=1 Tax=Persicirhabdus sediminis TaxID=454144 RepID=A0A8J7MCJ6_9BACT|nr:L-rhamnose mutarotase [Persicirhabdus sediminis]MBK1790566.1 L-rhamnose mutarotase [Persicirhabdus sediminis]